SRNSKRLRDLLCGDRVAESLRIEGVLRTLRGLRIRIHQETDWPVLLSRQHEVARVIKPDPIHLPIAEQALAQRLDLVAVSRNLLLQQDLAHIGRVDRKPALP